MQQTKGDQPMGGRVDQGGPAAKAWVTMITNDGYVDGVIALGHSLLAVRSRYELVVLTTSRVTDHARRRLAHLPNCSTRGVEVVALAPEKEVNYAFPHFSEAWTKLAIWCLEEYERLVWLDADMLVRRNMDELFDLSMGKKAMAAVSQCLCNSLGFSNFPPYFKVENCPFANSRTQKHIFNAGLLVIKPSVESYKALLSLIDASDLSLMHFAEQDLLNDYFKDDWHVLGYQYNATTGISKAHPDMWDLGAIKNIHYVGEKPWVCDMEKLASRNHAMSRLYTLWWDTYHEGSSLQKSS